jgi:hypothetical protein
MKKKVLFFSVLIFVLFQELESNELIINQAIQYGINLSDPNDPFFHDICFQFTEIKKDITLEYRRKYFFFPLDTYEENYTNLIYQNPIRNNSKECFFFELSKYISNPNLGDIFIPLFFFQFGSLLIIIFVRIHKFTYNSPARKRKIQKKSKIIAKNDEKSKKTYSEFVPDENKNVKKVNVDKPIGEEVKDYNNKEQLDLISSSKQKLNNADFDSDNYNDIINSIIINNNSTNPLNDNDNEENPEFNPTKEKSADNYTFGLNSKIHFSADKSYEKENEKVKEKKEDRLEKTRYIFNQINKDRKKPKTANSNMNADTPIVIQKNEEIFYIREEYFYFGYLLATSEDKRNFIQIYLDLLEQCQFFYKFFFFPFNIYEDRVIQMLYYTIKINFYFLFNCLLIKSSVINEIYDNKNRFINDFYRALIATILTYVIGLFFYYLTNIKRIMVERRHTLMNMNITDIRLGNEMINFSMNFCMNFLFNKIIFLTIIYLLTFIYSAHICLSFCSTYSFTQIIVLKSLLLSIAISLATPFVACCFPAFLRKIAISKKKAGLYNLLKIIEILFIP